MSEKYKCNQCGYVLDVGELMCSECSTGRFERVEAERRWIPVSKRLPKRDGFYLVLENVNQVAGYYHWCKQFGWNTDGGRIHIQSVTHWMPLPTPPEEE